ncbi:hypothetical protein AB0B66_43215 [Catellatospora sp. NPDC049111]|uniref:hypothetical protein n=1 Tax=Catellatospora sp. NPDC049111 TaxID=3155271 RepID=UPI0033C59015
MRRTPLRVLIASLAVFAAGAVALPASPAAAAALQVIDLGTLGGACCSTATDVNDHGVVIGYSGAPSQTAPMRAFRWKNGTMTDIGSLGGTRTYPADINNNGWIVGHSTLADNVTMHGFLWRPGVGMTDLGALENNYSLATGVNDAGVVVGRAIADDTSTSFRWANGVMTELDHPGDLYGLEFDAEAINNGGVVTGHLGDVIARLVNGVATSVPSPPANGSFAAGINNGGDIAGQYYGGSDENFVWKADGTIVTLGLPNGADSAFVSAINDDGDTVGASSNAAGLYRAVYWSEAGVPHRLPSLVTGGGAKANGVNKFGVTVGTAQVSVGGDWHAVIWTS